MPQRSLQSREKVATRWSIAYVQFLLFLGVQLTTVSANGSGGKEGLFSNTTVVGSICAGSVVLAILIAWFIYRKTSGSELSEAYSGSMSRHTKRPTNIAVSNKRTPDLSSGVPPHAITMQSDVNTNREHMQPGAHRNRQSRNTSSSRAYQGKLPNDMSYVQTANAPVYDMPVQPAVASNQNARPTRHTPQHAFTVSPTYNQPGNQPQRGRRASHTLVIHDME